jgi:pyruvate ferredoxin oxidoreductase alpha subunit
MRDAGWMQLFAENNQEAVDLHIIAFRLAEELSMPVMVCVDGFILTHAFERVDIPEQEQVDGFLPPYDPVQVLDPNTPASIGAMVGPEAFTEVRFLAHYKQRQALRLIPELSDEFAKFFGRAAGGLLRAYRAEDADTIVVAMGSVVGTIKDVVDALRDEGQKIGVVTLVSYRPFPVEALRDILKTARHVVVVEKSISVGLGGPLADNVDGALRNLENRPLLHSAIAGLGGRPITRASLKKLFHDAVHAPWEGPLFLDLNDRVVGREIHRVRKIRRSGSTAENILRQLALASSLPQE